MARFLINHLYLVDLLFLLVFPLLFLVVGYLFSRRSRKKAKRNAVVPIVIASMLAVLTAGTYLYGKYIGARQLTVRQVEVAFADLPEAFDGYRIVHVSDLHAGTMPVDLLSRVVDSINAQHPDLIAFTGDMQNVEPQELEPLLPQLKRLKARDGICSILGNHDYGDYSYAEEREKYNNIGQLLSYQQDMEWRVLANTRFIVRRDSQFIVIAGMENDGEAPFPQLGNIQQSLDGIHRGDFIVMLEHDPTAWRRKILRHCHAQLTLSGHTHGGQLNVFGWSLASLRYREYAGLYTINNRWLHVSSGLNGAIPVRIGVTPEIVVITLKKSK
jgi:predicted MPP superfamily phosphohydrolase